MNLSSTSPSRLPDFRVTYRLFTAKEGGRKTPAYQGIRWDFRYEDKAVSTGTWMIHPEFLGLTGEALPTEFLGLTNEAIAIEPLPMLGQANMFILSPELRSFHQQHLRLGTRGYFVEGPRRVGVCEVVEIMNLRKASVA